MTCRSCGHEIAANAIVCYRCGTPTAIAPVERPVRPAGRDAAPRGGSAASLVTGLVVLAAGVSIAIWRGASLAWSVPAALGAAVAAAWIVRRWRR